MNKQSAMQEILPLIPLQTAVQVESRKESVCETWFILYSIKQL